MERPSENDDMRTCHMGMIATSARAPTRSTMMISAMTEPTDLGRTMPDFILRG